MNLMILQSLFLDNPYIPEEVFKFCRSDPAYCLSERAYEQADRELQNALGYSRYSAYEVQLNDYIAHISRAYYLFGLGLREEVLRGIGKG